MSSKSFNWDELEEVPANEFNWDALEEVNPNLGRRVKFGEQVEDPNYELKRLGRTARDRPEQLLKEVPGAIWSILNSPLSGAEAAVNLTRPKNSVLPASNLHDPVRDFLHETSREGLSEEEWAAAEDIESLEAAFLPFFKGGKVPKKGGGAISESAPTSKFPIKDSGKFESGLTKSKFVESKRKRWALMSPEHKQVLVSNMNKEASALAKKSLETHKPLTKRLATGEDFYPQYETRFKKLKNMADKANPDIDITPVSELMERSYEEFKPLRTPDASARLVMKEANNFYRNPPTGLSELLKTYRSNNRKLRDIPFDKRQKLSLYTNFLEEMNQNIAKSFETTLPADSAWLNEFKGLNEEYSQWKSAQNSLQALKPIIGDEISTTSLKKWATDPKAQKKLEMTAGKELGGEIIQLSKDYNQARVALKEIPTSKRHAFDAILNTGAILFPTAGRAVWTARKGIRGARQLYGWWLSRTETRKALNDAYAAIAAGDLEAYKMAASILTSAGAEEP